MSQDNEINQEVAQEKIAAALTETQASTPKRALVVAAHPDDIEFGCSGTVAQWVKDGAAVAYVICTDGSHGTSDPKANPRELAKTREQEQRAAAATVGVHDLTFLGYEDSLLIPSLELRKDIARQIRRFKPDTMIIPNPTRQWNILVFFDHPDHLAAGEAALCAFYPAARDPFTFPELLQEGYEPHAVKTLYIFAVDGANYWSDISETIDLKIEALAAHKSQVSPEAFEWVKQRAATLGQPHGLAYAESFRRSQLD
jgi:LmbE family N-acetylglucosaminyl deacetylase